MTLPNLSELEIGSTWEAITAINPSLTATFEVVEIDGTRVRTVLSGTDQNGNSHVIELPFFEATDLGLGV
jgi:hypothetical protein